MLKTIQQELKKHAVPAADRKISFFKTGPGEYAEHDQFLGVPTPHLRKIAKVHRALPLSEVLELLHSPFNDERMLALIMMVEKYQKGDAKTKEEIFKLYKRHLKHVNNWNLVDISAHYIVGAHLYDQNKDYLLKLADSPILWERRVAIVSTWYFIRQDESEWTVKIAKKLLDDEEDLIHKAVGWMLREMGKRDEKPLIAFLNQYADRMPRTMLRYALEKLSIKEKKYYMS